MFKETFAPAAPTPQNHFRPIESVTLKSQCGCGFTAHSVEEGLIHAEETGHTLHIQGTIRTRRA